MIETDRLVLRPLQVPDFGELKGIWGNHDSMSFYPEPFSDDQIREIISKQIATYENHGYGLFAVLAKKDSTFIGDCGITIQVIDGIEEFEIGYRVRKEHWGQGYAAEAALAVKKLGFETLRLKKLCSYMESAHKQSRRVAEKIGMTFEKEYSNPNNRGLLTTVYSIKNATQSDDKIPVGAPR